LDFLLKAELVPEESYNSDEDPGFIPPPIFEPEYDYDEYSDGEIKVTLFTSSWKFVWFTEIIATNYRFNIRKIILV
jgi:hypothetical protein